MQLNADGARRPGSPGHVVGSGLMTRGHIGVALVLVLAESWKLLDKLTWQFEIVRAEVLDELRSVSCSAETVRAAPQWWLFHDAVLIKELPRGWACAPSS